MVRLSQLISRGGLRKTLTALLHPAHVRTMVGIMAALATLGSVVVAGWNNGHPAERLRLLSGAAWLPSAQVGQLTLLDGSSAEVAARVRVAIAPHSDIDVVQHGATAYAVNRSDGSISRVDGATFEVTAPATPIPDAKQELDAFAGPDSFYVLDTKRGLLATVDPVTLATRGSMLSLAVQVSPQATILDDTGRLWLLDTATGDITWTKDGLSQTRRQATPPGSGMLVLADGFPILIDVRNRTAKTLDPDTGDVDDTTELGVKPNDRIEVGGSLHTPRIYVTSSQGTLAICELTAAACTTAIPLSADSELGAPVEAGDRVFVPDYKSGQVWIIDLEENRVVAQSQVMPPATRFQILNRDGIVFFNDPYSERAGIIRLDGGVVHIPKYDPNNPGQGLTTSHPIESQGSDFTTQDNTRTTPGSEPISSTDMSPDIQIVVSRSRPRVGEEIALRATVKSGPDSVGAHWAFGDGQESHQLLATHHWDKAQIYQVTVRVTFPDGRTAVTTQPIQVTETPKLNLTITTTGSGRVNSQPAGISCPPTCTANFAEGSVVQLTATASDRSVFVGWSGGNGACTDTRCQLTMPANAINITASFQTLGPTRLNPAPTPPTLTPPTPTAPTPTPPTPAPSSSSIFDAPDDPTPSSVLPTTQTTPPTFPRTTNTTPPTFLPTSDPAPSSVLPTAGTTPPAIFSAPGPTPSEGLPAGADNDRSRTMSIGSGSTLRTVAVAGIVLFIASIQQRQRLLSRWLNRGSPKR